MLVKKIFIFGEEHIHRIYKREEKPHLYESLIYTLAHSFQTHPLSIKSVYIVQY